MVSPIDFAKRRLSLSSDRIHALPVVVLMPHEQCDCRCVMCDIWKAGRQGRELSTDELTAHLESLKRLRVRRVILSGGEALLHSNLWALCEMLRDLRIRLTLVTSGQQLSGHADDVARWIDHVVVSLDGSPRVHDRIRNVEGAADRLQQGVRSLRAVAPKLRITAQCTVQRMNYFDIGRIIETARQLPADEVTFRCADVSSEAFMRTQPWDGYGRVALTPEETKHFELVVESVLRTHREEISSGFVKESPEELRALTRYFRALNDEDSFPIPVCNAPWVSAVISTDGSVRPCLYHQPFGNINEGSLETVVNGRQASAFREDLDMADNPICRRCVNKLHLSPRQRP